MPTKILYVCEQCYEHDSEICGWADRNELRVMPGGQWLCAGCFDSDYPDAERHWNKLQCPPEYLPKETDTNG